MLPSKKRVTKKLFLSIMKTGKVLSSSFFLFRYIKQDLPQYAFVASKSVAKKAVERNSLRRRGYSAIAPLLPNSGAGIFFFKKPGTVASFKDVKLDIENLLKRAVL